MIKTLSSHNVYQLINNISHQHQNPSHIIFNSRDNPIPINIINLLILFSLLVIAKCKLKLQRIIKSAQLNAIM